jgi:sporulation protein YlmC with PRC-barrel domain
MTGRHALSWVGEEVAVSMDPSKELETDVLVPDVWSDQLRRAYGFRVIDQEGTAIGEVEDLFVEPATGRVRFLRLESGGILGFGKVHLLVPVEAIMAVGEDEIFVDLDIRACYALSHRTARIGSAVVSASRAKAT